ncbi:hypothetical protein [Fulvivirga sp.]|uniref:hypothetical protein n=1 Tax=Fulvivirga sp. TaxID=1931237 RepID=UPI0032EAB1B3
MFKYYFAYKRLLKNSRPADFLVSANQIYRNQLENTSYNRFADPLLDQLEEMGHKGSLVEQSKTDVYITKVYKNNRFQKLDDAINWGNLRVRISKKLHKVAPLVLIGFDDFLRAISKVDDKLTKKINLHKVKNIAYRINRNKSLAKDLLKKIKPKAVLLVCYYGEWQQALLVAAKEMKIPTFDIQHGIIYKEHYSYGNYSHIPSSGLSTLPDYFWTWSQYESNVINSWSPQLAHQAVALGNPWLMVFKENKIPQIQDISELLDPTKKLILYTLGNRGEQFPDYLVSFIKEYNRNYQFWFRLHPRQLPELDNIRMELERLEILDLINIEEATVLPLPNILKNTSLHITLMSSVAIEAAGMEVKSLILHTEGKEYYQDHEIKEYCCFYDDETEKIEQVIKGLTEVKRNSGITSITLKSTCEELLALCEDFPYTK